MRSAIGFLLFLLMLAPLGCQRNVAKVDKVITDTTDQEPPPKSSQEKARERILELGGKVDPVRSGTGFVVQLQESQDINECIRHLRPLGQVRDLDLSGTGIRNETLRELAGLSTLRSLNLSGTDVTLEGLVHLRNLTGLEAFHFRQPITPPGGFSFLIGFRNLRELDLGHVQVAEITDAGLTRWKDFALWPFGIATAAAGVASQPVLGTVKHLTKLEKLDLHSTGITDSDLVHCSGLTELRVLRIDDNPDITDTGLAQLKGLTKLTTLYLGGTSITDASLVHLHSLPSLQFLSLSQTKITKAGIAALRQKFPKLALEEPNPG